MDILYETRRRWRNFGWSYFVVKIYFPFYDLSMKNKKTKFSDIRNQRTVYNERNDNINSHFCMVIIIMWIEGFHCALCNIKFALKIHCIYLNAWEKKIVYHKSYMSGINFRFKRKKKITATTIHKTFSNAEKITEKPFPKQ